MLAAIILEHPTSGLILVRCAPLQSGVIMLISILYSGVILSYISKYFQDYFTLEAILMSDPKDWNKAVIEEFRANKGKVGGHFENATLVLVHTTGAKSGLERINPMMGMADGDRIIVIASKGGAPEHPAWFNNLVANPEVVVEYGEETFKARAAVPEEPERSKLYSKMAEKYPFFADYEQKTTRAIPVVTLNRR
jgi:deazaflavin-dependent oxidoreductase (nitroreductase family)